MRAVLWVLLLASALSLSLSSCLLAGKASNAGRECTDSSDCDDNTLGCVPLDDLNPGGTRVCMPPAGEWQCNGKLFGDTLCDCGCGFQDIDCPNLLSSSCDATDGNNCPLGQQPLANDNTKCQ